jgi:hypothetical protein
MMVALERPISPPVALLCRAFGVKPLMNMMECQNCEASARA